ncbi:heme oxygenase (biliverdin-producing) [Roseateles sp. LYH14W]|uniref:Heme oxygenase (Biliverdin-producing) n=1 Tax=Pelomonas parva TaxID=3299032 RepID=A0ABW7F6E5_9BURK
MQRRLLHHRRMNTATRTSLSSRLKQETRPLHTRVEQSGVMAALLRGRLSLPGYCALLRNLHAIYEALEAGLGRHPVDARLWRPELSRVQPLEQDLDRLHATPWRTHGPLMPATVAYVERLTLLGRTEPVLLLAHAYLRYLGDLHGGQVLARLVSRQFALDGQAGTAFYAFGDPAQVEALKADFRAGLDALPLTTEQADAFVAEACQAFRLHRQLFEELAR